jgi:hypothetical protein
MILDGPIWVLERDDDAWLAAFAEWLRHWEPRLDVYRAPRDARLFEPDGTLYAIALGDGMTVTTERRTQALGRGDALVVPQGLALDVEPAVDLLCVRHDGPPPDHFRERFIQIWGFEHAPAPRHQPAATATATATATARLTEVIEAGDVRFRLPYAVLDLPDAATEVGRTGLEAVLLIGLEGTPRLILTQGGACATLRPGAIAAIGPGLGYQAEGAGRLGRLTLLTELAHQVRRRDRAQARGEHPSPEFRPGPARPETS